MPRPSLPRDPNALASIVEAMIFASEDPVPPRTLLRLLYEDPDEKSSKKGGGASLFESGSGEGSEGSAHLNGVETTETPEEETPKGDSGEEAAVESSSSGAEEPEESRGSGGSRMGQKELREIIDRLNESYDEEGRSFRIVEIAGGFQFATTKDYAEFVGLLSRDRAKRRLSPAALETLSIIAYRQPVTKPEVEAIRGVNCDQVLVSLMERELITISGRADTVGRPLLYATTDAFLRAFGLNSLSDLPKLRELEELMEDDAVSASRPGDMPPEFALELLDSPDTLEGTQGSPAESDADECEEGETTAEADEVEADVQTEADIEVEEKEEESEKGGAELIESESEGVTIIVDIPDESGEETAR